MRGLAALALAACLASAPARAQSRAPEGIAVVDVPLVAWIASREHALADTISSLETGPERRAAFLALVDAMAGGDWARAGERAGALRYDIAAIREDGHWYVIASDASGTGRDPIVAVRQGAERDLVLEAPHVPFEQGTGEQAAILLRDLGGRAALISGAHRCASRSFTACDGKTGVCGTLDQPALDRDRLSAEKLIASQDALESYRESDPAHNTESLFHAAHVALTRHWPDAVVVSLHGMRRDTDGVATSLILSNGVRGEDAARETPATRLRLTLESRIGEAGTVVSCNVAADEAHAYRKLCGYTNVQGRHANGDPEPCRDSVAAGSGRFIHVEQDWRILAPYARSWPRIREDAVAQAFMDALGGVVPRLQ